MILGGLSATPAILYGLISVSFGSAFLPNTLLQKGQFLAFHSTKAIILSLLGYKAWEALVQNVHLYAVEIACLSIFVRNVQRLGVWSKEQVLILILVPVMLLHLQFARTGWFYRYEAYLLVMGLFAITLGLRDVTLPSLVEKPLFRPLAVVLLSCVFLLPLVNRVATQRSFTVNAAYSVYAQQYQMARFLRQFYQGQAVAANDIGAINYLADLQCLDLAGLASDEVLALRSANCDVFKERITEIARKRGVRMAVLYESWFPERIPAEWVRVGRWTIPPGGSAASPTVSFYATSQAEIPYLTESLRQYSAKLPKRVQVSGLFATGAIRKNRCLEAGFLFSHTLIDNAEDCIRSA